MPISDWEQTEKTLRAAVTAQRVLPECCSSAQGLRNQSPTAKSTDRVCRRSRSQNTAEISERGWRLSRIRRQPESIADKLPL